MHYLTCYVRISFSPSFVELEGYRKCKYWNESTQTQRLELIMLCIDNSVPHIYHCWAFSPAFIITTHLGKETQESWTND